MGSHALKSFAHNKDLMGTIILSSWGECGWRSSNTTQKGGLLLLLKGWPGGGGMRSVSMGEGEGGVFDFDPPGEKKKETSSSSWEAGQGGGGKDEKFRGRKSKKEVKGLLVRR